MEICERMQWHTLNTSKAILVDIKKEPAHLSDIVDFENGDEDELSKAANG